MAIVEKYRKVNPYFPEVLDIRIRKNRCRSILKEITIVTEESKLYLPEDIIDIIVEHVINLEEAEECENLINYHKDMTDYIKLEVTELGNKVDLLKWTLIENSRHLYTELALTDERRLFGFVDYSSWRMWLEDTIRAIDWYELFVNRNFTKVNRKTNKGIKDKIYKSRISRQTFRRKLDFIYVKDLGHISRVVHNIIIRFHDQYEKINKDLEHVGLSLLYENLKLPKTKAPNWL